MSVSNQAENKTETMPGTAANGHQKLLFSLKQLEYLQYYIHEHKLADPRVVKGLMGGENAGWPEDFDFDGFTNEGRIPLPLNVLLPSDLGEIVSFALPSFTVG